MQNIEFPQAIVDVQHVTCFRFEYADHTSALCSLEDPDEFLNENVPDDKPIAVILNNESYYCGTYAGIEDYRGELLIKIRSFVRTSFVISIPAEQILGWCLLPETKLSINQ